MGAGYWALSADALDADAEAELADAALADAELADTHVQLNSAIRRMMQSAQTKLDEASKLETGAET